MIFGRRGIIVLLMLVACGAISVCQLCEAGSPRANSKSATFSIVAVDPEKNEVGCAVASKFPEVGRVVAYARADVGAMCTQHYHVPEWGERCLNLLAAGRTPSRTMVELLERDRRPEQRQVAIIDMQGRIAVHNPSSAPRSSHYWGSIQGHNYSCQGNTLTSRAVLTEMSRAFEETEGSLSDKLMAALIAGDCAGGDHRGRLAAGIRVAKKDISGYWLELQVDESQDAVRELARNYAETSHAAKGKWRGGQLPFEMPCPDRAESKAP